MLDQRSTEEVEKMLYRLTDQEQRRLIRAMGAIQVLLADVRPTGRVALRRPASGDYGWVVHRHGALYAEEYGWDETFEALDADRREVHGASPPGAGERVRRGGGWRTGRLRSRLVGECIRFARQAGYERIVLWTNDVLDDARRIYERAGFSLAGQERHHSFGRELIGQHWWKSPSDSPWFGSALRRSGFHLPQAIVAASWAGRTSAPQARRGAGRCSPNGWL